MHGRPIFCTVLLGTITFIYVDDYDYEHHVYSPQRQKDTNINDYEL